MLLDCLLTVSLVLVNKTQASQRIGFTNAVSDFAVQGKRLLMVLGSLLITALPKIA
jgi:hypothetical protein